MDKNDFTDDAPGRLAEVAVAQDKVLGFVPDPLPPTITMSMETAMLLSRADNLLGRLDGMTDAQQIACI